MQEARCRKRAVRLYANAEGKGMNILIVGGSGHVSASRLRKVGGGR